MKIRYGLMLSLAVSVGSMGCASSGGAAPGATATAGGVKIAPGQPVRQTDDTRAADDALKQAHALGDSAQAKAQPLYQTALASANKAIAADSMNPLPYMQKGQALIGLDEYAAADSALTKAQKLRPLYQFEIDPLRERAWIALYNKAAPIVNQGDYKKAASIFEQANDIYKGRPEAMIILGQIYAQLHDDTLAIKNLDMAQKVIADRGQDVDSTTLAKWKDQAKNIPFTKAQVLADAGRFEEAITLFRQLAAKDPNDLTTKRNLATLLLQAQHKDEAVAILDSLMTRTDLTPQDYYQVGIRYYQAEVYPKAAVAFEKAAEGSPKDRDALEMWTRCLAIDSAYAKVPPPARRWIALDPNNRNAYILLAQALNKQGTDTAEVNQLVAKVQGLKVAVDNLTLHRLPDGGGDVTGDVINESLTPGASVTLHFTFYDESGASVGTNDQVVQVGAKNAHQTFRMDFNSSKALGGYGYTLSTM